jgi:hypothetical protein
LPFHWLYEKEKQRGKVENSFFDSTMPPYFCGNFYNGTKEKIQRLLVVSLPGFNCCIDIRHLFTLGMAYPDPPFHDHLICKGAGHYVKQPVTADIFFPY